jgi:putative transposase
LKPSRQVRSEPGSTYFVTSQTSERKPFFRHERWALAFVDTLCHYRGTNYLLHEYVVMPDHFHCLLTPVVPLERAMQLIKGGFSRRATVELESRLEVWQRGFTDHRIRDWEDYQRHRAYIVENPVRAGLCDSPESYAYSSVGMTLDAAPPRLKPPSPGARERHG